MRLLSILLSRGITIAWWIALFVVASAPLFVARLARADGCTTHDYGASQLIATVSSGNVANATAVATLPAPSPTQSWHVTEIDVSALGATAALGVQVSLSGLNNGSVPQGSSTAIYPFQFPAGATVAAINPVNEMTYPCPLNGLPGTAIVLTLPAGGAGNTNAAVTLHGFVQ
jgi:hypothetical protein